MKKKFSRFLISIVAALIWTLFFIYAHQRLSRTILNTGRWFNQKIAVENSTANAIEYQSDLPTLAEGLDLNEYGGFHFPLFMEPFQPKEIRFKFDLSEGAYFNFVFGHSGDRFQGVRISNHSGVSSILFVASNEGEFLQRQELDVRRFLGVRRTPVVAKFEGNKLSLQINGNMTGEYQVREPLMGQVGFLGGSSFPGVKIHDIEFLKADGSLIKEDFSVPYPPLYIILGLFGSFFLLHFFLLPFLKSNSKTLIAFWFAELLLFSICFYILLSWGPHVPFPEWSYTTYRHNIDSESVVRERIQRDYGSAATRPRVLFVGTSQTWGAGAIYAKDNFVQRLQAKFPDYQFINAGISGYLANQVVPIYFQDWVKLGADHVVVNLSSNDIADPQGFVEHIEALAKYNSEHQIKTLFLLEANELNSMPKDLPKNHAVVVRTAKKYGFPVFDLHGYLAERRELGFLWWDHVHPTSAGYKLIAEGLTPVLRDFLNSKGPQSRPLPPSRGK